MKASLQTLEIRTPASEYTIYPGAMFIPKEKQKERDPLEKTDNDWSERQKNMKKLESQESVNKKGESRNESCQVGSSQEGAVELAIKHPRQNVQRTILGQW